jgi:hypothetical protein
MVFYGGKNRRYVGYFALSSREFSSYHLFFFYFYQEVVANIQNLHHNLTL